MREGWEIIPFEKSIQKVKYTTKIPSSEYLPNGLFPIVSQEEGLISGYWDNEADVFHHNKPVVIFGDHTRIIKYVDFDFVLGADGVKILLPVEGLSAKFLSYYLRWYRVPSLGYSRHFKLLKEASIPLPPIAEQEKIVAELDCLTGIIEKKKQQLEELDRLAQSIFYDMFGEEQAIKHNWKQCRVGDVYKFQYGKGNKIPEDKGEYPCYGSNGMVGHHITFNSEDAPIIGHIGAYAGIVNWGAGKHFVTYNGVICKLRDNRNNPKYGFYLLKAQDYLNAAKRGGAQPFVSYDLLEEPLLYLPPFAIQNEFAQKIEAIEKEKELVKQSIVETETLFNSRMDYWFNN